MKLIVFILFISCSAISFSADVRTSVTSTSDVGYFFEEKHHTKADFIDMNFCWGKKSTSSEGTVDSERSRSGVAGSLRDNIYVGGHGVSYRAKDLLWETNFDEEEYIFNINIKKTLKLSDRVDNSDDCNTSVHTYKLNSSEVLVESSLTLDVPRDVWVVRFKSNIYSHVSSSFKFKGVYELGNAPGNEGPDKQNNIIQGADGYVYFFVRPGENIKLDFSFNDNSLVNSEYVGNIEVTFLGHNRCDEIEGADGLNFKNAELEEELQRIYQNLESGAVTSVPDFHSGLNYLSCLTKKKSITEIIYDGDLANIEEMILIVHEFKQKIKGLGAHLPSRGQGTSKALDVVSDMFSFRFSHNVVSNLAPLCLKRKAYNRESREVTEVYNYKYIGSILNKIKASLERRTESNNQQADYISNTYTSFLKILNDFNINKIKENTHTLAPSTLFAVNELRDGFTKLLKDPLLRKVTYGRLSSFPLIKYSKYWNNFYLYNKRFREQINNTNNYIVYYFDELVQGRGTESDLEIMEEMINDLEFHEANYYQAVDQLSVLFPDSTDALDYEHSVFANIGMIANIFYPQSRDSLVNGSNGFLSGYVRSVEDEDELSVSGIALEEIMQCMRLEEE